MLRVLSIGLPVLLVVTGLPLSLKLVPPNRFYGFRMPTAFASLENWYRLNFLTGLALIAAGIVGGIVVMGLMHGMFNLKPEVRQTMGIMATAIAMLIFLLPVVIYSNKL